jgi:DNA-binding CsgD family transcriptional regulator
MLRVLSIVLIAAGVVLPVLNLVFHWEYNIALPLLFLVLGGGFFLVVSELRKKWVWAVYLYIPGLLMATFGIIFLFNILTADWNSWAYAWLLLLAAIGIGLLLANRELKQRSILNLIGWGLAISGITFFAVFGAVAGGLFIQVIAPIFLAAIGFLLYWLKPNLKNLKTGLKPTNLSGQPGVTSPDVDTFLAEPLSQREVEVLRLINSGLTNAQIAARMTVAPSTVKTHINNIYSKMGVQTRVQAVNKARALGLLVE